MAGVIVLDTSVLITFFDGDDSHHAAASALLVDAVDEEFAVNPLTWPKCAGPR